MIETITAARTSATAAPIARLDASHTPISATAMIAAVRTYETASPAEIATKATKKRGVRLAPREHDRDAEEEEGRVGERVVERPEAAVEAGEEPDVDVVLVAELAEAAASPMTCCAIP